MLQDYQDAMAIVMKTGTPHLFITMTANANWKEITENLWEHQAATDRPDLVARVFEAKKNELLDDLEKRGIFGPCANYIAVTEFQGRGLPHEHIIVSLKDGHKFQKPEIVDEYIHATFPDEKEDPELFGIVKRIMLHSKCGINKPNAPCMRKGYCRARYPQKFRSETTIDENGKLALFNESRQTNSQRKTLIFDQFECLGLPVHIN